MASTSPRVNLQRAQRVEIISLVDNFVDMFLADGEAVKRPPRGKRGWIAPALQAEHGYAAMVRVYSNTGRRTVFLDAGFSEQGLMRNLDVLEVELGEVEAVVLSHGHPDHRAALVGLIARIGKKGLPIVVHPDAFLRRSTILKSGEAINHPMLQEAELIAAGAKVVKCRGPKLLAGGAILATGEVPRKTVFEKGLPSSYAEVDGGLRADPLIMDDQSLVIDLEGKGLVIISGCAHAGIINTIAYAAELSANDRIHAVIGGFHLSGPDFDEAGRKTIEELKRINPKYVIPSHCTGWRAVHAMAEEMPEAFIHYGVGSTYHF